MSSEVLTGDCVEAMAAMPVASVDAVVTDPPYGLSFMGKAWDDLGKGAEQHWHGAVGSGGAAGAQAWRASVGVRGGAHLSPAGGRVLDPFTGSGSTGCAAILEGFDFVGVEKNADYVVIAEARMRFWREHPTGLPAEQALVADARRRRTRESGQLGFEV